MAGVFAEKSICPLVIGGGCEGKTQFESVVCLKKFVSDSGGWRN